jgi:hypothetical protein
MRLTLTALITLLPAVAVAQAPGDTVSVVVPEDRNCSDFVSQQDAQGWFDAMQIITGEADPHALDADGDGQPCESIKTAKREVLGDSVWIDYRLEPHALRCVTGREVTFDALREQLLKATRDSVAYRGEGGIWPRYECIHTISQMVSQ